MKGAALAKGLVSGLALLLLSGSAASAQGASLLLAAARRGDLVEAKRLVEAGASVDAADEWGASALAFAAGRGHVEVVRFLLAGGADPNRRERFFHTSPLDHALGAFGGGSQEAALLLLRGGADDRESALSKAFEDRNLKLAEAAVAAGPIYRSRIEELRAGAAAAGAEFERLFGLAKEREDRPAPSYSPAELALFSGRYESASGENAAEVVVEGESLTFSLDEGSGHPGHPLTAVAENRFRAEDGGLEILFSGRAQMIEAVEIRRPGEAPLRLAPIIAETRVYRSSPSRSAPSPSGQETHHWPGFRGDNASGIGDGLETPTTWNLDTGEGARWIVDLPGLGNSSPIVWGNRIFVTTAEVLEGSQEGIRTGPTGAGTEVHEDMVHRWLVLAYDKKTGKLLWETEVGRGPPASKRHFKATQANSTPVTDGQRLVVAFPTAGLACLDMDGKIRWRHDLGSLRAGAFNDPSLEWGFASSPVIFSSQVILQVDIHDGAYLASWDLLTGRELWKTARDDVAPSWATPTLWRTPTGPELVANASVIHSYDPRDGRELWSLSPNSVQVVAAPIVSDGVLYVSAGYPPVKPIYALRSTLRGDFQLSPGIADDHLLWSQGRGGAYMPTPIVYRGIYYVVHHNGRLVAYEAGTGVPIYKARFSRGGTFTASPVAANGALYTGTEEGLLYVFAAGPEYREIAVNDFAEPLMATPAISAGLLLVRTPSRLIALGAPKGAHSRQ